MKELIPANEYGIFADMKETVRVNSLKVAEYCETWKKSLSPNLGSVRNLLRRTLREQIMSMPRAENYRVIR